MSRVEKIETEIAQLSILEKQELANWFDAHISSAPPQNRPRLEDAPILPMEIAPDAFAPLTDEELKEWGIE